MARKADPAEVEDLARRILAPVVEVTGMEVFTGHSKNHILSVDSPRHGRLCLKISPKRLAAVAAADPSRDRYPDAETRAFEILGDGHAWAPRLVARCPEHSWLLREWKDGETIDRLPRDAWTPGMLRDLYGLFADLFSAFHGHPDVYLVEDVKAQNVIWDGARFYFIDFGGVKTMADARRRSLKPRLGVGTFLLRSPEFLAARREVLGPASDLFAFSSLFWRLVMRAGNAPWPNVDEDPDDAMRRYRALYLELAGPYAEALAAAGFSVSQREALVASLSPDLADRPDRLPPPGA